HVVHGAVGEEFVDLIARRALSEAPSFTVEKFGPVALVVTALWGRVGSTLIFDAQTEFLIESGAIVVRVFVDHHPSHGRARVPRRNALVGENFTRVCPHIHCVAERDGARSERSLLRRSREYRASSAVRRLELELAASISGDQELLSWAGAAARL